MKTKAIEVLKRRLRRSPKFLRAVKRLLLIEFIQTRVRDLEAKLIYSYLAPMEARLRKLEALQGQVASPAPLVALSTGPRPTLSRVVSQAATQNQFFEPEFASICQELAAEPRFHRKLWEFVYALRALRQEGMVAPGKRGLGFGVGKDPIIAPMVKDGCSIVATDLDVEMAREKGWVDTNQFSLRLSDLNERGLVSDRLLAERVTLRSVDMNAIPEDLKRGEFDFVWSACAFEHLGSLENGMRFVLESLRCLKPGGVAVHTTEFNISSDTDTVSEGGTVLYRKCDIEELARRIREAGRELELNFNVGDQPMDVFYDVPPYSDHNHLKLRIGQFVVTSIGLLIRKPRNS